MMISFSITITAPVAATAPVIVTIEGPDAVDNLGFRWTCKHGFISQNSPDRVAIPPAESKHWWVSCRCSWDCSNFAPVDAKCCTNCRTQRFGYSAAAVEAPDAPSLPDTLSVAETAPGTDAASATSCLDDSIREPWPWLLEADDANQPILRFSSAGILLRGLEPP